MKKKLLLIISSALFLNCFSQNIFDEQTENLQPNIHEDIWKNNVTNPEFSSKSLIALYDSIINWKWDTVVTSTWQPYRKTLNIIYDVNNNKTNETFQSWNGSIWENDFQYSYTYDVNYNRTNLLNQNWNGSIWVNDLQYVYTYDVNNNSTSLLTQDWNGSIWGNYTQSIYTYDGNNNVTNKLLQNWNGSAWRNDQQTNYTYDVNDNMTSNIYQQWDGTAWINSSRETYTYDSNNNILTYLTEYWNGSAWMNNYFSTYTYDVNNNLTNRLSQRWITGSWMDGSTDTYTYDISNNLINRLRQNWIDSTGIWLNSSQYNYIYNANNSITSFIFNKWLNNVWEMNQQEINTYDADNIMDAHSFKFWHDQVTFISTGDSVRYYFHAVPLPCSASFTLYPDTAIEHNWFLLATGSGEEPITYFWEWGDGTTSTGSNPSHTYTVPGYYNICMSITDSTGCSDTYCDSSTYVFKTDAEMISVNVINQFNVGIEEVENNFINIYPNPTTGLLNIETAIEKGIYQLQDLTGKQLLSGSITATRFSLDISTLSKGIYLLSVFDGEQVAHKKIVKE